MSLRPRGTRPIASLALAVFFTARMKAAEFPDGAQPQLATNAAGAIWLTYRPGEEVFATHSGDGGDTFAPGSAKSPRVVVGNLNSRNRRAA